MNIDAKERQRIKTVSAMAPIVRALRKKGWRVSAKGLPWKRPRKHWDFYWSRDGTTLSAATDEAQAALHTILHEELAGQGSSAGEHP